MSAIDPKHVLIVDDDPELCEALTRALADGEGKYLVSTAANAQDARWLAAHEQFDAAIVDVTLPGELGTSLAEHLAGLGIPCVLMSGDHREKTPHRRRFRLVNKPFRLETLRGALRELLEDL
jgi:two-component system, OmpR family, phosphate regulon response regulator OmpR